MGGDEGGGTRREEGKEMPGEGDSKRGDEEDRGRQEGLKIFLKEWKDLWKKHYITYFRLTRISAFREKGIRNTYSELCRKNIIYIILLIIFSRLLLLFAVTIIVIISITITITAIIFNIIIICISH